MALTPAPSGGTGSAAQWWAVWTTPLDAKVGQQQFHIIQAAGPPATGVTEYGGIVVRTTGPYATQAAAESAVGSSTGTSGTGPGIANPSGTANQPPALPSLPSFGLLVSGISGWFIRGLKVVLGSVLMILAVSRLSGVSNKVTELASNIKVVPV
jgi:hypothetical protein